MVLESNRDLKNRFKMKLFHENDLKSLVPLVNDFCVFDNWQKNNGFVTLVLLICSLCSLIFSFYYLVSFFILFDVKDSVTFQLIIRICRPFIGKTYYLT